MSTVQQQQQHAVPGKINVKRVATYFKKSNKAQTVWTQQTGENNTVLITDRSAIVNVPLVDDMRYFASSFETTMFKHGEQPTEYSPARFVTSWKRMLDDFNGGLVYQLTPTRYLYEGSSQLWRRFETPDELPVWIDKVITDMFDPDPDQLDMFRWEYDRFTKRIRVAQYCGWVAIVMPGQNIGMGR